MSHPQTCAEAGAYFMDGARSVQINPEVCEELGGWCGFVSELCSHAEYADALAYAGYAVMGDYPGVWGYEVGVEYGKWFATKYKETGVPTYDQRRIWLLNETEAFFLSGGDPREDLSKALREAQ